MVGRLCDKCQKQQAIGTTDFIDVKRQKGLVVCKDCWQELEASVCDKCKSKPLKYLEDDGKGEKIQVCEDCHRQDEQDDDNGFKCSKCKQKSNHSMSASFTNGINTYGYCAKCFNLAEKDTTCYKCRKNQRSGEKGTQNWNFCAECLKEPASNKKCCLECQKIVRWGNEQGQNFLGWEDEEWNDNGRSGGKRGEYCNWVCLRDASQRDPNNPHNKDKNICEKCKQLSSEPLVSLKNARTGKGWMVCPQCLNCQLCKKNRHEFITNENNEKWEPDMLLCRECDEKLPGNKKNKEPTKDRKPKPGECCEECGASSIVHQTKTSYTWKRIRYTIHKTDFTRSYTCWFGFNCPCAENYRKNNQQTCPQCKKHEFPDMSKGWMLDYEIKMAFCSPQCHVAYRELKWEEAEKLTQIEMFPPSLDVEVNPNSNVDWEKEGLKREVLFLRELVKELEKKISKPDNLTPLEKLQANYLKKLQQNTLNSAEKAYSSKYGSLSEDGSEKGKGLSKGVIAVLIGGGIVLIAGIIFLLTRNKKKRYE